MSNKGKKIVVISHADLIALTLWAQTEKASLEGLAPAKALEMAKVKFPKVNLIEATLIKTFKTIGISLVNQRTKAVAGQPKAPRIYNLAKCVRVLYEKLGEPIPDVLNRMANQQ